MKQKQRKERKQGKSIFHKIIWPFLILVAIEAVFVIFIPVFSGMTSQFNRNEEDMLGQQVENRKNYLENTMVNWSDLKRLSLTINEETQRVLDEQHLTVRELVNDPEKYTEILVNVADDMIAELYAKRVNGIFLMLNTQSMKPVWTSIEARSCGGLYIRDLDPSSAPSERNADLLLKRAPTELVRKMNISTDSDWRPKFIFSSEEPPENYAFIYQPFQTAYEADTIDDPADFGYWAPNTSKWYGEDESGSVTYSLPLVLENGTVYGVLGIEVTDDYLRTLLPYEELAEDRLGSYVLAQIKKDEDSTYLKRILLNSNTLNDKDLTSRLRLTPSEGHKGGYRCTISDESYYVAAEPLSLYSSNTPFESQQWVLLGMMDTKNLYQFARHVEIALATAAFLMIISGVLGSIFISRRLSVPVRRLSNEVYGAQEGKNEIPRLSTTGIREIDHFAAAITELSHDVLNTSTRFLRIIEMATTEIGGFEIRQGEEPYITDNLFSMLGLQVSEEDDSPSRRQEVLSAWLRDSTPAVCRSDGSKIYEVAKPNGELRYIRVVISEQDGTLIGLAEDATALTKEHKKIEYDRDYDLLTGLMNRRAFYNAMEEKFLHIDQLGHAAMIMMDLDNLKRTNDSYGHEWGDQYIRQAAGGFVSMLPDHALLARLSGDEFILFLYGYESAQEVRETVREFGEKIGKTLFMAPDGTQYNIRASGGVAWYPEQSKDFRELMKFADFAMYQIKQGEKGQLGEFDPERYAQENSLMQKRRELQQILDEQCVQYYFQPIVDAGDGGVFAYEALMRVDMPSLRTPDAVLNLAAKEKKLKDIERLTMLKATEYFRALLDEGSINPKAYLFVNSIADQCIEWEDQEIILERCEDFVSRIVIEITECNEISLKMLSRKQKMECFSGLFALDDYGSGYNGEKNLLELAPKFVKIDISIVRGLDLDRNKQSIVSNLISYAHERNMLVVAEGLETLGEIRKSLELGVDLLQGYALARPAAVPGAVSEEVLELIREFWEGRE